MAISKPYYMVLCKADNPGAHYVFATTRRFYRYSEAELYTLGLSVNRHPIILMVG